MKKNYLQFLSALLLLAGYTTRVKGQCGIPAPTITGNTLVCNSSGTFTLTANGQSTATTWYSNALGNPSIANGSVFTTPLLTANTTYYASQSASSTTTSIGLPPQASPYSGNTRGMYFTAPTNFTIIGLRVPTDASVANSNIALLNFGSGITPPLFPAFTNAFSTLYIGQNIPGTGTISVNIPITSGDVIGVLGDRGGVNSYAGGSYNTTLAGMPITLERLGMQFVLGSTLPQDIWTEPNGASISRVEIYILGACTTSMTPVTVVVSTPPQVGISGPPALCAGSPPATLNANGAATYSWTTGPTTSTLNVSPSSTTVYSVSGYDTYGCSNMATYEVTVAPLPSVTITPSSSVVCLGKSATLTLSGASTYTWSTGFSINPLVVTPNVNTTYSVTGTDGYGCMGTTALMLPVSPTPSVTTSASPNGNICAGQSVTLTANGGDTYSWSTGAGTQKIVVSPTGPTSYTAIGTTTAGCSKASVISLIVLQCVGLEENSATGSLSIFPNPTNGQVTIESNIAIHEVVIKDISGRIILDQAFDSLSTIHLNLDNLNAGVYFIEFPQERTGKAIKLVKE